MWIMTPIGFFSVVAAQGKPRKLTVRARVAKDLTQLRKKYLPELTPTKSNSTTDYEFRAFCTPQQWGRALTRMANDIDYPNFKDKVAKTQGWPRAKVYNAVWLTLLNGLEDLAHPRKGRRLDAAANVEM